jgi:phage shock protein PspC (stress-responsive transcriptional regulator)/predicted membrane protein
MVHMSTEDTRQHDGPPPPPPPSSPPPPRGYPPLAAIRRSRTDRHLAGVSGGLARYAGIDPLIIRILFVVLTFFGGTGVLLYALGWLLLPIEGEDESEGQRLLHGRSGPSTLRTVIAGVVAVIVGLILISNLFDEGPGLGGFGAVVVVAAVVVLVARSGTRPAYDPAAQQQQPPYGPVPPPEPGEYGQTPGTAYAAAAPPAHAAAAPPAYATASPPAGGPPQTATWTMPAVPPPPAPPKERSILGRVTFSVMLVVIGLMVGWNVVADNNFTAVAILASALAVVGFGLVVGAFFGRAYGLIFLGIVLSIATSLTAVVNHEFGHGAGQRHWAATTAEETETPFRLGIGEAELDLTGMPAGENADVDVTVGLGSLLVIVPEDARVVVDAEVAAGEMRILDEPKDDGTDLRQSITDNPAGSSGPDITIDAEVGLGDLEVRRAAS